MSSNSFDMLWDAMSDADKAFACMAALTAGVHKGSIEPLWCGCGNPEEAWRLIWEYLDALAPRDVDHYQLGRDFIDAMHPGMAQILDGVMGRLDLTEHGSSFHGAWLTQRGRWLHEAWDGVDFDELPDEYEWSACSQDEGCMGCRAIEKLGEVG